jgi:hypothetical protein
MGGLLSWLTSLLPGTRPQLRMNLKARPLAGGGIDWDLGPATPPVQNRKDPFIVPEGTPACDLIIHLIPTGGIKAEFDTEDPIWIAEGKTCPQARGNECPDQITCITATAKLLTLRNMNSRKVNMMYRLNFVGAGVPPCDPEIRNGGKVK